MTEIEPTNQPKFKTSLCELLSIEYPIIQAGMGNVASPELVAAVSNAGGLGILSGTMKPAEVLRAEIRKVRRLTSRPFGVNLILHNDFYPPSAVDLSDDTLQPVQNTLNGFRHDLGIPESHAKPPQLPPLIELAYQVILEESVPVFSIGLGNPSQAMVAECHQRGIKVMAMVSTLEDALEVNQSGIDVLVAQGSEAGGHRSTWQKKALNEYASIGTLALVTQIAEKIKTPLVAAGGISTGSGMLAALAMGAAGVLLGTRFVATKESVAPEYYKQKLLQQSSDHTTVTDVFTGMYARVLRNTFTENYAASHAPVLPPGRQFLATMDIVKAAEQQQNSAYYPMYAGQGIDSIAEIIPAAEVVKNLVREAILARKALLGKVEM